VYVVCTINSAICPCNKYVCFQGGARVCTTRVAFDAIRACPKVTRERACALACKRGMEACVYRLERLKESRHTETFSILPNPYSLNTEPYILNAGRNDKRVQNSLSTVIWKEGIHT